MKTKILIVMLLCLFFIGCNAVNMNPEFSQLLDDTTARSVETAQRAQENLLTPEQMTEALVFQSQIWEAFQRARDGIKAGE